MVIAHYSYLVPRNRKLKQQKLKRLRQEYKDKLEERRLEANDAVNILSDHAERKKQEEESKSGLIIMDATYGASDEETGSELSNRIDVLIPLQSLINDSQLFIPKGTTKVSFVFQIFKYYCLFMFNKTLYRLHYLDFMIHV